MNTKNIQIPIPFASIIDVISSLNLEDKRKLWQMLDEEISQAEEDLLEEDPTVVAEIEAARIAYQNGDYQTIDEYIASRSGKK